MNFCTNIGHRYPQMKLALLSSMLLLFLGTHSVAQGLNSNWERDLGRALEQFMDCAKTSADKAACSATVGQAVSTVYKVDDFYSQKLNRYLTPNEISKSIEQNNHWKLLGYAYDQKTLDQAQQHANSHKAVLAVYNTNGSSHVALILPGSLHFSGSWGFNVPNSASFSYVDPDKSYVGKGLSYGFAKTMMKDVVIYSLN
ncbi:MAG TPA: hypothetical protein VK666_21495 [Chryseolinea sp.]|nr:hypothetical protein [Chryseolinea sp.]